MIQQRLSWGQTIFCDDLRQEVAGKFSLMGIYQTDMIFPVDFPVNLTKLVLWTVYNEIVGAFEHDLKLNVYLPDSEDVPVASMDIPRSNFNALERPKAPSEDASEPIYSMSIPFIFSPLTIKQEGPIKVRMVCGDVVTRMGRLSLRRARPDESAIFAPTASPPLS